MRRAAGLVAVVAFSLALAGCGGAGSGSEQLSKDEYQQQGVAIGQRLKDEFSDIESAEVTDLSSIPSLMNRLGSALDALADDFDALSPPEEVEDAHDRFVTAARATANDAHELADRIENESPAELQGDLAELDISKGESFLALQEAMEDIKAAGYDFGDLYGD